MVVVDQVDDDDGGRGFDRWISMMCEDHGQKIKSATSGQGASAAPSETVPNLLR